jgi:hypothetical protein
MLNELNVELQHELLNVDIICLKKEMKMTI